jgi:hypothetical protein
MGTVMLSEAQQRRVWEGMLKAEIRANYFADLSGAYARRQRIATWGTLVLSSGTAVSIASNLPQDLTFIRFALAATAAGISAYSIVKQNQKFAVDSADLHARWNRLAKDYESLWENVYVDDAANTLKLLDDRATELSKSGAAFPYQERRMLRWQQLVERHRLAHP